MIAPAAEPRAEASFSSRSGDSAAAVAPAPEPSPQPAPVYKPTFTAADLQEALEVVRQLDPPGVACRDLRECLLYQLRYHQAQLALHKNGNGTEQVLQRRHRRRRPASARPAEQAAQRNRQGHRPPHRSRASSARLHPHPRSPSRPALQQSPGPPHRARRRFREARRRVAGHHERRRPAPASPQSRLQETASPATAPTKRARATTSKSATRAPSSSSRTSSSASRPSPRSAIASSPASRISSNEASIN